MTRTVFPADSASQVSTNRGSLLGRQQVRQTQQVNQNLNRVQGSALGRSMINHDPYSDDPRFPMQPAQHPLPFRRGIAGSALGRGGDGNHRPRGSVSERSVNQLNQGFQAMSVNPRVNIDITNDNRRNSQSVRQSQSLIRQSQSIVQAPQPVQYMPQAAPMEDSTTQKRFLPLSSRNMHVRLGNLLCDTFQVKPGKVVEWLEEGLIRVDTQKYRNGSFPYDIEPLTAQLTAKDIERWDNFVRNYDSDRELQKAIGPGQGTFVDFERDFGRTRSGGAASVHRYDPRCRSCAFRRAYCGGVDPFHAAFRGGHRRW